MVPESLCAKADYTVPILELVDVDLPRYTKPQEQTMDFVPPKSKPGQQCQLKTSIPRFGYTRGMYRYKEHHGRIITDIIGR